MGGPEVRLQQVETGHRLRQRLVLRALRVAMRMEPPDVIKAWLYRRDFFGRPYSTLTQRVMRGESEWTVGERELFAAFTSRLNQCRFCTGTHCAVVSQTLGEDVTQAVLNEFGSGPIDEKLLATLSFLEKVTLSPEDVGPEDAMAALHAGVSAAALRDAVYVCALFNMINRVADALDFAIPSPREFTTTAKVLLRFGYRLPA
jgi:uncharacterized peroxidase-related enzyme